MDSKVLFPFERNHYYTGKLLTARDFTAEQEYMNNKRRLINRFISGVGVVCGMLVSRAGRTSVNIESGFALDSLGREVIIPETITRSLSELDIFSVLGDTAEVHRKTVYLCVEYQEQKREFSTAMAENSYKSREYSRTEETYRLFLTHKEPRSADTGEDAEKSKSLEMLFAERLREQIYLAKIRLSCWGSDYEIEKIRPLPFGQLAGSYDALLGIRNELDALLDRTKKAIDQPAPGPRPGAAKQEKAETSVSCGNASVVVPGGARRGQVFCSNDVSHGLGPGEVHISLGLRERDSAVFGSGSVFSEGADYEIAARADFSEGIFRVGVLLKNDVKGGALILSWMAVRVDKNDKNRIPAPRVTVNPATTTLAPQGVTNFKAETADLPGTDVIWSVSGEEGGSIDSYGRYTAPAVPGVYTVTARSADNPQVSGVAYVVVGQ